MLIGNVMNVSGSEEYGPSITTVENAGPPGPVSVTTVLAKAGQSSPIANKKARNHRNQPPPKRQFHFPAPVVVSIAPDVRWIDVGGRWDRRRGLSADGPCCGRVIDRKDVGSSIGHRTTDPRDNVGPSSRNETR